MGQEEESEGGGGTVGGVGGQEETDTKRFFYEYASRRAQKDEELRSQDAEVIKVNVAAEDAGIDSTDAATTLGRMFADIGEGWCKLSGQERETRVRKSVGNYVVAIGIVNKS